MLILEVKCARFRLKINVNIYTLIKIVRKKNFLLNNWLLKYILKGKKLKDKKIL